MRYPNDPRLSAASSGSQPGPPGTAIDVSAASVLKESVLQKPPARVTLTSEEGEGLIERVYASDLPRADCTVVVQIIRLHFWLMLVIQEAKLSLKRFRRMLFGEPSKRRSGRVCILRPSGRLSWRRGTAFTEKKVWPAR